MVTQAKDAVVCDFPRRGSGQAWFVGRMSYIVDCGSETAVMCNLKGCKVKSCSPYSLALRPNPYSSYLHSSLVAFDRRQFGILVGCFVDYGQFAHILTVQPLI